MRVTDTEIKGAEQVHGLCEEQLIKVICFDEISLHRGHGQYVLVISAPELELALDVLIDQKQETLENWLDERGKDWHADSLLGYVRCLPEIDPQR